MKLADFIPGVSTAKLVAGAVGALAAAALILFAFFTVKGWHDDSQALAGVKLERDQAVAARAALDQAMTGKMQDFARRLGELQQRIADFEKDHAATGRNIDADVDRIIRSLPHAPPPADPAYDRAVRDGLQQLFAIPPGAKPRASAGGPDRRSDAGLPAAPAQRPGVPGRERADAGDGGGRHGGIPLPAAGLLAGLARRRAVQSGRLRLGDGRGVAEGDGPSLQDPGLRRDVPRHPWLDRAAAIGREAVRAAAGVGQVGFTGLIELARDDGR
jgi:hypothetical protein